MPNQRHLRMEHQPNVLIGLRKGWKQETGILQLFLLASLINKVPVYNMRSQEIKILPIRVDLSLMV